MNIFRKQLPPFTKEGMIHATVAGESGTPHRFHLRLIDPIAANFLWIDGMSPPLVLDGVAAEFFAYYLEGMWKYQQGMGDSTDQVVDYVVDKMAGRYQKFAGLVGPSRERLEADLHRNIGIIMSVAEGKCPVEAGLKANQIDVKKWVSPARMDLAITYGCNANCGKCYLDDAKKNIKPMSAQTWKNVIDKLWLIGIPQIVFTGGEPTTNPDLVSLVQHAEKFVTGLVTNGLLLENLAEDLQKASLDYMQVTIESCDPEIHNKMVGVPGALTKVEAGIRKAISLGMNVVTNTTLTKDNVSKFLDTIRWCHGLGIKSVACNTLICSGRGIHQRQHTGLMLEDLKKVLKDAKALASELAMDFQWYSPTCYNEFNPLELGLGAKACSAAQHNMTIQPDGSVLPCQSWTRPVGNILTDKWENIWNNPICLKLRNHEMVSDKCNSCNEFKVCGGGCPLDHMNGKVE